MKTFLVLDDGGNIHARIKADFLSISDPGGRWARLSDTGGATVALIPQPDYVVVSANALTAFDN